MYKFLAAGFLAAAFVLPLAGSAQQTPPPPSQQSAQPLPGHGPHHMAPFERALRGANLTAAQKTQMRQIRQQYRAAHPPRSPRNPQAEKAMHAQLLNVLTPTQRTQVRQKMAQMRAYRRSHAAGMTSPPPRS